MGREFLDVFTGWAKEYDSFVEGEDEEYREVFHRYDVILDELVKRSGNSVLEFGIGTGNLTQKLIEADKEIWAVEPSEEMRDIAADKLPNTVTLYDGDMQNYPIPDFPIDTIVSSYVFHHLTDEEKAAALVDYASRLSSGGKVIFADTMFATEADYEAIIEESTRLGYDELVTDLKREHYPLITTLYAAFKNAGFIHFTLKQMNAFVWIIEGTLPA